jgi:exodeoxyribonuclease VII small subunit
VEELDKMTFEEAFEALEQTVQRLEAGDLSLEEALSAFERGYRLAAICERHLSQAELRVYELAPDNSRGLTSMPFENWQREGGDDR